MGVMPGSECGAGGFAGWWVPCTRTCVSACAGRRLGCSPSPELQTREIDCLGLGVLPLMVLCSRRAQCPFLSFQLSLPSSAAALVLLAVPRGRCGCRSRQGKFVERGGIPWECLLGAGGVP